MAKKSTAARQANAARRSQTTTRPSSGVMLVRTPKPETNAAPGASVPSAAPAAPSAQPAPAPAKPQAGPQKKAGPASLTAHAAPQTNHPRALEVSRPSKPAAPKPQPASARQQDAKAQAARVARAKAMQRARAANIITPEHYGYVINDLKLIGALAAVMFGAIIVLHFVLPT